MTTSEELVRRHIIESTFVNPILGVNYIDWHTADGDCGLTLFFPHDRFDIVIRRCDDDGKPAFPKHIGK